jgi:hypothetical protein
MMSILQFIKRLFCRYLSAVREAAADEELREDMQW